MQITTHGGQCCGIRHIHSFGLVKSVQGNKYLEDLVDTYGEGRLLEAVLTDQQLPAWGPALESQGFYKVSRFFNKGSGNHCNVFHRYDNPVVPPVHRPSFWRRLRYAFTNN